ncbi:olfactory receptor 148-like, partial [Sciurus carolinensis]|uniref:olfactory receptor 148-like n=1 Tax=Sciurus carolinensis TaxID=30640 RepID=UPI001FB512F2
MALPVSQNMLKNNYRHMLIHSPGAEESENPPSVKELQAREHSAHERNSFPFGSNHTKDYAAFGRTILHTCCKLFFFHLLGSTEGCLYSVMAYDRYVAICHPLRYMLIMKPGLCVGLVMVALLVGCLHATTLTSFTFHLTYCGPKEVDHFFCDIPAILPLACTDSSLAKRVGSINVGFLALVLLFSVCVSYAHIGIAILRIRSAEGRRKAFSTCSAHLTAILCAYGPVIIIYLQRTPNPLLGAVVQILNNIVSPMLNSLIY